MDPSSLPSTIVPVLRTSVRHTAGRCGRCTLRRATVWQAWFPSPCNS